MLVQEYLLHLINGEIISTKEEVGTKGPDAFITRFLTARPNTIFSIGSENEGFIHVPARSIVYISTGKILEENTETAAKNTKPAKKNTKPAA